jgi:predicted RNA-binding Zn-ribbon protein involved in translation (DUF1610 family)
MTYIQIMKRNTNHGDETMTSQTKKIAYAEKKTAGIYEERDMESRMVTVSYHDGSVRSVDVEIDPDHEKYICPECGEAISNACANGHVALAIEEPFLDVV